MLGWGGGGVEKQVEESRGFLDLYMVYSNIYQTLHRKPGTKTA